MRPPSLAVVTFATIATLGQVVSARSTIQDVRVLPTCGINPNDRVMLEVFVYSTSYPTYLFAPTQIEVHGDDILIDFFPTSGSLESLDYRMFSIDLGSYPRGIYSFTIKIHNYWEPDVQEYAGHFQVGHGHCDSLRHLFWADYRGTIKRCSLDGLKIEGIVDDVNPLALALDVGRQQIYWASLNSPIESERKLTFERANLDGSERQSLFSMDWEAQPQYLTVASEKLFWIESSGWDAPNAIWQANVDGTNVHTILNGLSYTAGLVAGEREAKIFWNENGQIWRANFDGSGVETVQDASRLLAMDARHSRLFFSSWREEFGLYSSNLDGTGTVPIIVNEWMNPTSLLLDCLPGKLYWLNCASPASIYRANIDGSDVEQVVELERIPDGLNCDTRTGSLYWVYGSETINPNAGILMSANADGTDVRTIAEGVGWPFGLTVDRRVGNLLPRSEGRSPGPRSHNGH